MSTSQIYLTVGNDPEGRGLIAVASLGHPQRGDGRTVLLTLEIVKNMKEAKAWFRRVKVEQPWMTRN